MVLDFFLSVASFWGCIFLVVVLTGVLVAYNQRGRD